MKGVNDYASPDNMQKVKVVIHSSIPRRDVSMRAKVLTLTLLLLLGLVPLAMPTAPAPPGLPSISVEVDDVGEVETDPVDFNHVLGKATVTVQNLPLGGTVNVNANTNSGWMVTVSPTEFDVPQGTSSTEERISMDIRVPAGASAEKPIELSVFANVTNALGFEYFGEGFVNITVEQYYGVRTSANGTMAVEQGKNLTHQIRVTNTGNGMDNFTVQLNNEATLATKGLELEYDEAAFEAGKDRMVPIKVVVSAAETAEVGTVEALFTVRSKGDNSKFDTYKLTITVRKSTSGGNGGNGDPTDGDEETSNRGLYIAGAILVVILVLIIVFVRIVKRRVDETEAGDEDHVVGGRKD